MTAFDGFREPSHAEIRKAARLAKKAAPKSRNEINRAIAKLFPFLAEDRLTPFQQMVVKGVWVYVNGRYAPLHTVAITLAWDRYMREKQAKSFGY